MGRVLNKLRLPLVVATVASGWLAGFGSLGSAASAADAPKSVTAIEQSVPRASMGRSTTSPRDVLCAHETATTKTPLGCGVPTCGGTMDNPHYSSGGIIAKGHFFCDPGVTYVQYSLYLFVCTSNPTGQPETSWGNYGCLNLWVATGRISSPPDSSTRYVPGTGVAHGTGWFIACNVYAVNVGGTTYPASPSPSQGAYLSG
jgi:hypothetical protein